MRVNLIRSILVFQEKKYCLHENAKLVFFKKKYTKTIHTQKKKRFTRTVQVNCTVPVNSDCSREQCNSLALFAQTVQVNCTVHANTNLKKQLEAASPILRSKRELVWPHRSLNSVFDITKHHVWCGCSKRRSNHTNKRSLSN